ncbi:hypothetical protein TIFTF001_001309 [Ficus carica]|uniref:BHLH domain-containing protein n=1 Tax=Ficus carica TaxID=3494 RepID=A0AA87YYC3_FICCA|nr:hypothetical protein TIFTF001_001309 [Ficus carica]
MESSDLQQHPHHHYNQQQQMNSGLIRYRSAPSSYFSDMMDREFCQQFFNRPSSPETERIFARFMTSGSRTEAEDSQKVATMSNNNDNNNDNNDDDDDNNNNETVVLQNQQQQSTNINNYSSSSGFYHSSSKPPLPNLVPSSGNNEDSYPIGMNQFPPMRTGGVSNSNLIRHSSSPAGLFASINLDTGFGAVRGMGSYGANNSTNEEASFSPPSRLNKFSSGPASSPGLMSPIAEIDDKNMVATNQDSGGFGDSRGNNYVPSFPVGSWDDSSIMSDNTAGLKRLRDEDVKPFSSETQNVESGTRPLAHHLSLPKTSSEMAAIENERMRKLQELVPNMEKQTNTADMLDLAVEYIKDLQKQVKTLSDSRAKCTCSEKQQKQ